MSNTIYGARTVTRLIAYGVGPEGNEPNSVLAWDSGSGTVPSDADIIATALELRDQPAISSVELTRDYVQGELVDLDAGTPAFTL